MRLRSRPRHFPRSLFFRAAIGAAAAACAAGPLRAHADDAATAQALFDEATDLKSKGQWAAACPKFESSYKLDPALGTLLNLADCHAQSREIAAARAEFLAAADLAAQRKEKAREDFARAQVAELEAQLAQVTLSMAPNAVVDAIAIDGQPIDPRAWSDVAFLAPGMHWE